MPKPSAIPIRTDECFGRLGPVDGGPALPALLDPLQGPLSSLTRVAACHRLEVAEGLLGKTALVFPGPALQQPVQRLRQITNLQGGHGEDGVESH
jgi:hypothetical protein